MSSPLSVTRPSAGRTSPEHALKVVVLPAPLGPISPVICPVAASRLSLCTAVSPPKRTVRSRTASSVAGTVPVPATELAVRDLTVRFGGLTAVHKLSLDAATGQITGLIGPNGAGKTTTFNACSGLVRPAEGRVTLNGEDISGLDQAARARRGIGRTYQHIELWDSMTVAQNVALGREAGLVGRSIVRQLLPRHGDRHAAAEAAQEAISL